MADKIISFSWVAEVLGAHAHLHYQRIMFLDHLLIVDTVYSQILLYTVVILQVVPEGLLLEEETMHYRCDYL